MSSRPLRSVALLALAALASGFLGLIGAHAHALGETDLVGHALVAIDHLPAASAHYDRAVELRHPVCNDCLLASLKVDGRQTPPPAIADAASDRVLAAPDTAGPRHRPARRAPARAPPHS